MDPPSLEAAALDAPSKLREQTVFGADASSSLAPPEGTSMTSISSIATIRSPKSSPSLRLRSRELTIGAIQLPLRAALSRRHPDR